MTTSTDSFRRARDLLLSTRTDYAKAYEQFEWPRLTHFNFALDWFDAVLAVEQADQAGLRIIEDDGTDNSYTFAELSRRSNQVANWLRAHGVIRGTRVLVVLGNQVELWETTLALMKLGAVLIPATTLLTPADMADRIS